MSTSINLTAAAAAAAAAATSVASAPDAAKLTPRLCRAAAAAALALVAVASAAQPATLAPAGDRIDDATIQRDHVAFEGLQARIAALNAGGRRLADYHLAKAQCWLDTGFHEYTRNDRSGFVQAAFDESEKLVSAMEARTEPLSVQTPLLDNAMHFRPDLWRRLNNLKHAAGLACAAPAVACAEVELVHAGNELKQQQWRHAEPYVRMAEDLLADGETRADSCTQKRTRRPPD